MKAETVAFGGQQFLKATLRLNSVARPKSMDYTILAGPNAGKSQFGIYALDGDMATGCFAQPGKPRPTDFASNRDDRRTLSVWKKVSDS